MKILNVLFSIVYVIVLSSCGFQQTREPDHIRIQLKWIHQAQFAGFYTAEAQGYYADENLDVTFIPGGVGIDLLEGLLNGENEFSLIGGDSLLVERSNNKPIKAIATTYPTNPFMFGSLC